MLGLPETVVGCLFDMDGVLTRTAVVHAAAWQEAFDRLLADRAERTGTTFEPFDPVAEYDEYVDGRSRIDGTRAFLAARHLDLPDGEPEDPAGIGSVYAVANLKNDLVRRKLHTGGVQVYEGSIRYVKAAREAGLLTAVVSASANTEQVLAAAGIAELFDARIDGVVASQRKLAGKPAPDMFVAGAQALGITPDRAAVFEDALAGVAAGRAGGFARVIGVDRVGQAAALREHGADVTVDDLAELLEQP